jgi:cob(I)alamin adenosyltransferase
MRIYTRTGDDGTTGLGGGARVPQAAPAGEALGAVDELNATLGAARAHDPGGPLHAELATIQSRLLAIGARLAGAGGESVGDDDVATLERWIDRLEDDLPPIGGFVLPGATAQGARLHVARTVCRRAERRAVALRRAAPVEPAVVRYLNRLGDLLFVMARWYDRRDGAAPAPGNGPAR